MRRRGITPLRFFPTAAYRSTMRWKIKLLRVCHGNQGGRILETSGPRTIELWMSGNRNGSWTKPMPLLGSDRVPPEWPPHGTAPIEYAIADQQFCATTPNGKCSRSKFARAASQEERNCGTVTLAANDPGSLRARAIDFKQKSSVLVASNVTSSATGTNHSRAFQEPSFSPVTHFRKTHGRSPS